MLLNLERKFLKDPNLRIAYVESMREYLSQNHMRRAPLGEHAMDDCFFLPHHGVVKESSTTTKMRLSLMLQRKPKAVIL